MFSLTVSFAIATLAPFAMALAAPTGGGATAAVTPAAADAAPCNAAAAVTGIAAAATGVNSTTATTLGITADGRGGVG